MNYGRASQEEPGQRKDESPKYFRHNCPQNGNKN